jgi:hypothetical protein
LREAEKDPTGDFYWKAYSGKGALGQSARNRCQTRSGSHETDSAFHICGDLAKFGAKELACSITLAVKTKHFCGKLEKTHSLFAHTHKFPAGAGFLQKLSVSHCDMRKLLLTASDPRHSFTATRKLL